MARKQGSHSDITRPRIRQAALRLIARHGFAAVSVRQIAAEVDMQAGALYNYVPDKQTLLFDLMRGHMEELLHDVEKAGLDRGTPLERLDAFTHFHLRWHLQRYDAVFVSYMELRNLTPENFANVEKLRRAYEDVLEDTLRDGFESGAFSIREPRLTTMALIALLTGVTNWYRPNGRLDQAAIEALYVDLVRQAVGVPKHSEGTAAQ